MKNLKWMWIMALVTGLAIGFGVGCSDDDDDNGTGPEEQEQLNFEDGTPQQQADAAQVMIYTDLNNIGWIQEIGTSISSGSWGGFGLVPDDFDQEHELDDPPEDFDGPMTGPDGTAGWYEGAYQFMEHDVTFWVKWYPDIWGVGEGEDVDSVEVVFTLGELATGSTTYSCFARRTEGQERCEGEMTVSFEIEGDNGEYWYTQLYNFEDVPLDGDCGGYYTTSGVFYGHDADYNIIIVDYDASLDFNDDCSGSGDIDIAGEENSVLVYFNADGSGYFELASEDWQIQHEF